jgi:hypothetical protein
LAWQLSSERVPLSQLLLELLFHIAVLFFLLHELALQVGVGLLEQNVLIGPDLQLLGSSASK